MNIQHNIAAMFTNRQLNINTGSLRKNTEKLSSGYRINRAADDAAGLTISEKMRWQIRGLNRASKNIQDGISFVQVAEGALNEEDAILQRMRELSVQAANDTNTDEDRAAIQAEIDQLVKGSDAIFKDTTFNTLYVWRDAYKPTVTDLQYDMKVYNDSPTDTSPAGIIWGETRYTWDELGIANPYENVGSYTTKQVIDAVTYDETTDSYVPNGEKISLRLDSSADSGGIHVSRIVQMTANDDGIKLDGVTYGWDQLEDASHQKTFDKNNIQAGTWSFNTYNGYHVEFEIPDSAASLDDVIAGLNGDSLSYVAMSVETSFVTSHAVDAELSATLHKVTNANAGYYGDYNINADASGLSITYTKVADNSIKGTTSATTTWEALGVVNADGEWEPSHKTDLIAEELGKYSDSTAGDDHSDISDKDNYVSYILSDIDSSLSLDLKILQESNMQSVLDELDDDMILAEPLNPAVRAVVSTTALDSHVTGNSANAKLTYQTQYDLGRDYDSTNADLMTGTLTEDASSDKLVLNMSASNATRNGDSGSRVFTSTSTISSIKNSIKQCLESTSGGRSLTIYYEDAPGNTITTNYSISSYTQTEKDGIRDGTVSADDIIDNIYNSIVNGTTGVTVRNSGDVLCRWQYLSGSNKTDEAISTSVSPTQYEYKRGLHVQAGALGGQDIYVDYKILSASIIGITNLDVSSYHNASATISRIDHAMSIVNSERSRFGAYQNRLQHAMNVDDNTAENTQAAESQLRDTDMAEEMVAYSAHNIIMSAAQAMLAQTNNTPENILSLLQ
jgi:flagellin-like hook-associated protein FlgL